MSVKQCQKQPLSTQSINDISKKKISTTKKQKKIVNGFIRLSFLRTHLNNYIMPQDIINIIYAFVTFRDYITIAMVGHVDSGKSTLAGRLLHNLGNISNAQLDMNRKHALEIGKESFEFAFCMDKSRDERARGVTIMGSAKHSFTIGTYKYSLIDVPGHRDFFKNTVKYLSMADAAILVVPIQRGYFETSISKGNHKKGELPGMTVVHARLCYMLGVEQIIVVFNRMDQLKNYGEVRSHERFIECKQKVTKILDKIGYKTKKIPFIPISALNGENIWDICTDKTYFTWYRGFRIKQNKHRYVQGFTLMDALRDVITPNNRFFMGGINQSFKMSISNYYKIKGVGDVVHGRVICGGIDCSPTKNNFLLRFYPHSLTESHEKKVESLRVASIQKNYRNVDVAECGDIVSLNIKGMNARDTYALRNRKGCLSLDKCDATPQLVDTFTVLVFVVSHPGRLHAAKVKKYRAIKNKRAYVYRDRPYAWIGRDDGSGVRYYYAGGYTTTVLVSTWRGCCKLIGIKWVNKKSKPQSRMDNPPYIEHGDYAEVIFKSLQPFIVYPYDEIRSYGRIVVADGSDIVMIGRVLSVTHPT